MTILLLKRIDMIFITDERSPRGSRTSLRDATASILQQASFQTDRLLLQAPTMFGKTVLLELPVEKAVLPA